jgi:hypothetical protein
MQFFFELKNQFIYQNSIINTLKSYNFILFKLPYSVFNRGQIQSKFLPLRQNTGIA